MKRGKAKKSLNKTGKTSPKRALKAKPKAVRRKAQAKPARMPPHIRNRSIEAVLADFAHDVRTPLTGIVALTELLSTSPLGDREKRWVAALRTSAQHLASLTTLIVDSARGDKAPLRDEPFDPRLLAREAAEAFAARAEANGLTCSTDISPDLPRRARGDATRLRAALENLLDNAVKFTSRGAVGLTAVARGLPGGRVKLTFTVTDNGIGLSATEIKRLFRPYAQANASVSRRFGGTGLGLALVKRFARRMGGNLRVTSSPGAGATFTLDVVVGAPGDADLPFGESRRSLRVLCVEDNAYSRAAIGAMLREFGHVADFEANGEAAVASVRRGGFDLVLLDITLGGIDGFETARRIRAIAPARALPIIAISGRDDPADAALSRAAGMNGYLVKPVAPNALMAEIESITNPTR